MPETPSVSTDKREEMLNAFCKHLIETSFTDPATSAIVAGYSAVAADMISEELLALPEVKKRIEESHGTFDEDCGLTYKYKLQKLKKVIDISIPDYATNTEQLDRMGLTALDIANKMQGHYLDDDRDKIPEYQKKIIKTVFEETFEKNKRDF
jgi:hypothetical protein